MVEVPEKGRDTTQWGRAIGPLGWNSLGRRSVSFPSSSECLGFTPEAISSFTGGLLRRASAFRFSDRPTVGRVSLVSETRSCGAGRGGAEATGGANAGRNQGGSDPLRVDPTGGAAPLGASPENAVAVQWAVGAVCCGALGCRVEEGLLSVTVDGKRRTLCSECAVEFVEEELE